MIDDLKWAGYIGAMKMKLSQHAAIVIFILIGFTSCSSQQEIMLKNNGSGTARVEIELHPFFVQYLRDLTAAFGDPLQEGEQFRVFDELKIAQSFSRISGLSLDRFDRLAPGHIRIDAAFDNLAEVIPAPDIPGTAPVISIHKEKETGGRLNILEIDLNSENVQTLYSMLGMEEQQNMLTFGPQPDPLSREEYMDMMAYALGTYADETALRNVLESQSVYINIEVEGEIIEGYGVTFQKNTASLYLPFLRPATLKEPVRVSLKWRE